MDEYHTTPYQERFSTPIRSYLLATLIPRLKTQREALEKTTVEWRKNEEEYYRAMLKACELQEELNALEHQTQDTKTIGEQFDLILRIAGVRKIVIAGGSLIVLTHPLTQCIETTYDARKEYDIGQWIIEINLLSPTATHGNIRFTHGPYQGHHSPIHPKSDTVTCFGNSADKGLNITIDKLIRACDVVNLIHLIITFLEHEQTTPTPFSRDHINVPIDTQGQTNVEGTKADFIHLLQEAIRKRFQNITRKDLIEAERVVTTKGQENATLRNSIDEHEQRITITENEIEWAKTGWAQNESIALHQSGIVFSVTWEENKCLVISLVDNIVIHLETARPPRIMKLEAETATSKKRLVPYRPNVFTTDGYLRTNVGGAFIAQLQAQGKIAEIIAWIWKNGIATEVLPMTHIEDNHD